MVTPKGENIAKEGLGKDARSSELRRSKGWTLSWRGTKGPVCRTLVHVSRCDTGILCATGGSDER